VAVQRDNPYLNFNFLVDVGLGDNLGFREVELPSGEIDVIEYREGDDRTNTARKLPGLVKYANVTLRRGFSGRTDLFEWWKSVRDGQVARRDVTITLLDEARQPVARWLLRNAWPVKIEAGSLNATGNEVVIETLELAHEGLELD
jgi:phage tail-like protein